MAFELPGLAVYLISVATFALIYGLLVLGLNLHFGYTGLLNFGHVAFFAIGAYTAAIVTSPPPAQAGAVAYTIGLGISMPFGFLISLGLAATAAGTVAFIVGLTSIRLDTHYLAIVTFALAELIAAVIENEQWLTGGFNGMNQVPRPGYTTLPGDIWPLMYLGIVSLGVLGVYLFLDRLVSSPFGRLLRGIRDRESGAQMLGKNTSLVKLKSFVIGGAIAGLAGGLYAHFTGSLYPEQFITHITFLAWIMMLLGGAVSNVGAIAGAFLFIGVRELLRFMPNAGITNLSTNLQWVLIGIMFVAVMRYRPQGLFGNQDEIISGEEDS